MKVESVKGYCTHIFNQAGMNFAAWWNSEDPDLKGKPFELAAEMPMLVIARAEELIEFEKGAAA